MKRLRPFPTPEEIRGTDIPEAPWIEPFRGRLTEEHLRCRLAQENRLLRIYEPRFRHPDGHSDRRLIVRLLRTALRGSGLAGRAHRNFQRIEVETREWFLPGLGRGFDGFRILHVSDMHLEFDPGLVGRLRNVVTGLDYDLACLTGDFFDLVFDPDSVDRNLLGDFLSVFRPPIRAVLGNHDILAVGGALEGFGVPVLLNESEILERGGDRLFLAGVDDPREYRAARFEHAFADRPDGVPSVLMAHSPQVYREAAQWQASLVLCGHTHGGQVSLPFGIPLSNRFFCPLRFVSRDWRHGETHGYTSHGCGGSKLPYRLNAPAEVTVHTLRSSEQSCADRSQSAQDPRQPPAKQRAELR